MIGTICFVAALVLAPPQGGQGGFGGGGIGGAQGGAGGRMGEFGEEQTYKHILTPGDKTEWPFKVKAGEVIIFKAHSDSFDPAIEVQDAAKQKIAENDDEEPGKQDALLLVYFEKEGSYTAHVKNYRSTAGGPYTFQTRRFVTTTLAANKPTEFEGRPESAFFRILLSKGDVVSLMNSMSSGFSTPIGPDGKPVPWLEVYEDRLTGHFRADQDGAYYVQTYLPMSDRKTTIHASIAPVHQAILNQPKTPEPHAGLDVWKYKAKAGEFLRFEAKNPAQVLVKIGAEPPASEEDRRSGNAFQVISENTKWSKSALVLFHRDGEYEMLVNNLKPDKAYTFHASQAWKPWDGVSSFAGDLEIGKTVYYGFDAKPVHIARLQGEAKTFDLEIAVHDEQWRQVFRQDDSNESSNPEGTLALPRGGRHYLAVSCFGDGGGGTYKVNASPMQAVAIKLGETREAALNSPLDGLWSLQIEKPGTVSIRLKSPSGHLALTDADGNSIHMRTVMVQPGEWLMFFDIQKPGQYRIWRQFTGSPEKYSLRLDPVAN